MIDIQKSSDNLLWVTGLARSDSYGVAWPEKFLWHHFHVPRDGVFVDVAACCGEHTLRLARWCRRVVAVEPMIESREVLSANLAINHLRNVEVLPYAVSDREETLSMRYNGNTSHVNDGGDRLVSARPLDDLLADEPVVHTINIDVEGFEDRALLGMKETLRRLSPRLVIETHESPRLFGGIFGGEQLMGRVQSALDVANYDLRPIRGRPRYWTATPRG